MFRRLIARLSGMARRNRWETELDEEVRFHVEMEIQANIARGMTPAEARRIALRDFGGATQTHEAVREVRTGWIDSVAQDVKYGVRSFRKNPGFTAVAILTLGLGIGANTAIFSLVDAIVFRPLPFAEPGRLVWIMGYHARSGRLAATIQDQAFEEIRRRPPAPDSTVARRGGAAVRCRRGPGTRDCLVVVRSPADAGSVEAVYRASGQHRSPRPVVRAGGFGLHRPCGRCPSGDPPDETGSEVGASGVWASWRVPSGSQCHRGVLQGAGDRRPEGPGLHDPGD